MKIKSKRIISAFLIVSTLFGNMSNLSAVASTRVRDVYSVIDNDNPINNRYDFLMQSDEPLKIRKKLLGDNISISNMVGTYGTLHDNGDYFIYNLNDFLNGVEEFDININGKDEVLRVIPAPEMVYDDDFIGINHKGFDDEPIRGYGHYGNSAKNKTDMTVVGDINFIYNGLGIEFYSFTTKETGRILYKIHKEDNEGSGDFNIQEKSVLIDTKSILGGYRYSELIESFESDTLQPRSFSIKVGRTSIGNLDKIKIYYPIGKDINDDNIKNIYSLYFKSHVDYIDVYMSNECVDGYVLFERNIFKRYGHSEGGEDFSNRIVFDTLVGKYGELTYDNTVYAGVNNFYTYSLNGWLTGIEEFNITIDGISKILRIIPVKYLDFEKQNISSNLDVYIKSENMLSLSLNTNSVTFENYSGVQDLEMLGAIDLTINSSLPYSLNAYIPAEISNADGSKKIPIDILNIKESNEADYQQFESATDKVVLKDGCIKGNNLAHSIDLKLASNQAYKADIYKTVIKFEAEQK